MHPDIIAYNNEQQPTDQDICHLLAREIDAVLPEAAGKVWHAHPVWFINGNPIVGYSKQKAGLNLMFWSGQSFDEPALKPEGKFKAAEITFTNVSEIKIADLHRWLIKGRDIQWDYKNIVRRKGQLERLC